MTRSFDSAKTYIFRQVAGLCQNWWAAIAFVAALCVGALLFVCLIIALILSPTYLDRATLSIAAPYQLLNPEIASIYLPDTTTNDEDTAAVEGLVRAIHAHGRDALIRICTAKLAIASADYGCVNLYFVKNHLPEKRSATK